MDQQIMDQVKITCHAGKMENRCSLTVGTVDGKTETADQTAAEMELDLSP